MNKKLVNIVLVLIVSLSVLLVAKETFAATNAIDITNSITTRNNTTNNATNNTTNISGNNTTNNTANNTTNRSSNNSVLTTNNTSNYNNSSLPKTGIEDSIPGVVLVVILGISAVYAYNKIQYYKNI